MTALIDFSLFSFKCIELKLNNNELFTYKSSENDVKKIIKELFEFFTRLTISTNLNIDFYNNRNSKYHANKNLQYQNHIIKILQGLGWNSKNIEQHIIDNPNQVKQLKIKAEKRIFFIEEIDKFHDKRVIIKPLFLDINHVIYNDTRFQKNFNVCLVCWEKRCN